MKKSEKIKQKLQQEENDLKAMGLFVKVLRENRLEHFEENWLPQLMEKYTVEKGKNYCYTIKNTAFGVVDFYPKKNKCLLRKNQQWIKPGLNWIGKNLLNK